MPPMARSESPIYVQCQKLTNGTLTHFTHAKIKALAITTAQFLSDFAIGGSVTSTTLVTTQAELSFYSHARPLTS